jgi:thiosulfate reductase cytochrome b subunit
MNIPKRSSLKAVQPGWLRICHWVNVLAMLIMVMSGWRIYNASPLFSFTFPRDYTLGGWLGGALQWHFAAMWLFVGNGLVYLLLNILTGRARRRFLPISVRALWQDFYAALRGKLGHADLTHYNAVQKAFYIFVVLDSCLLFLSGLVLWKSVQFPLLRELLGGYESARIIHFSAMALIVGFVVVHVVMVLLVPRTLLTMIRGR